MNPKSLSITYGINQLFDFIDDLASALFTELISRHTSLMTKTGLKRRSTCSFNRPNRLGHLEALWEQEWAWNTGVDSVLLCKFCVIVILLPFWYTLARTECIR